MVTYLSTPSSTMSQKTTSAPSKDNWLVFDQESQDLLHLAVRVIALTPHFASVIAA